MSKRILVVDDLADVRVQRAELLADEGYEVVEAEGLRQAVERFRTSRPPVVVTDLRMPEGDGLAVAKEIKAIDPQTMVIIVTGEAGDTEAVIGAIRLETFAYIQKGSVDTGTQLLQAIRDAFQKYEEETEKRRAAELELQTKNSMLSFLTHTMRNTVLGGPATIDEILWVCEAWKDDLENDVRFKIVSDIGYLRTSFEAIEKMLDTYSIMIREPEQLRKAWDDDTGPEVGFGELFDDLFVAAFSRLLLQESFQMILARLAGRTFDQCLGLKRSFLKDIVLSAAPSPIAWQNQNLTLFRMSGEFPRVRFAKRGIKYNVLYSVLSELLLNAVKYSNGFQPVQVSWTEKEDFYEIVISNTFDQFTEGSQGSRKGLDFVRAVVALLPEVRMAQGQKQRLDSANSSEKCFVVRLEMNKTLFFRI